MTLHYNIKKKKSNKNPFIVVSLCIPFSLIKILKWNTYFSKVKNQIISSSHHLPKICKIGNPCFFLNRGTQVGATLTLRLESRPSPHLTIDRHPPSTNPIYGVIYVDNCQCWVAVGLQFVTFKKIFNMEFFFCNSLKVFPKILLGLQLQDSFVCNN